VKGKNDPDQLIHRGDYLVVLKSGVEIRGTDSVHVTPSGGFVCIGHVDGNKCGGLKERPFHSWCVLCYV
jgi:hypothetical protein